jgi:hypothetical protein
MRVTKLDVGIDALMRGIKGRDRVIVAPRWVRVLPPFRAFAQRVIDVALRRGLDDALAIARAEDAPLTTAQPDLASVDDE